MKTIVKIEIAVLCLVAVVAIGLILISGGVLELFQDPVIAQIQPEPIPTDPPAAPAAEMVIWEDNTEYSYPTDRPISAKTYFAYDLREGEYLLRQGQPDEKLYIASITKLLTVYTAMQHMDLQQKVWTIDGLELVPEDSSIAELWPADRPTVEQLIAAMMLPSGNDAAQVMAVAGGRIVAENPDLEKEDAVAAFVEEMNRQAALLGMTNSHFVNPDGFHDPEHYTTMDDLVTLAVKVLTETQITQYTSSPSETVEFPAHTLNWKNTNLQLHRESAYYKESAIGLKTGYTEAAGNCLLSAFFEEDRIILIGVFGCMPFTEDRYMDTAAIYDMVCGK